MNTTLDGWLGDLQSAAAARQLYPPGHPRLSTLLEQLETGARSLTAADHERSAFSVDGRVAADGIVLEDARALVRGLFATLHAQGYHRLTLRRDLPREEIEAFVAQLAKVSGRGAPAGTLQSSDHIRLSMVEEILPEHCRKMIDAIGECQARLPRLWKRVCDERELDVEALDGLGVALLQLLDAEADALVPLAALRSHDDYTVTHIANVAILAMALAEVLGVPRETVRTIGTAALLHDIGKLGIPSEILNAQGRLSDAKLAQIRRHPEEGARMLIETPGVHPLAVTVAYEHHVHIDGGGYPAVPRGWKTNLASAITQTADVYDALRSNRPYRPGLSGDRIAQIMLRDAGTVLHPELVRAFFDRVVPRTVNAG